MTSPFAGNQNGFDPTTAPNQGVGQDPWSAQPNAQQNRSQDPWSGGGDQNPGGQNQQGGFNPQQQNQQGGFNPQGDQNRGGFNLQQGQGGFNQQQNQGGFNQQQNQGGFNQQGQGGFNQQGQGNGNKASLKVDGPMQVDPNNFNNMFRDSANQGDIRKENGATLLIVPREVQYNLPSQYGGTYHRAIFDYLVVDGPRAGTVYRKSMNAGGYIRVSIENAIGDRLPMVGTVVRGASEKKGQSDPWKFHPTDDQQVWQTAINMGIQAGLLSS